MKIYTRYLRNKFGMVRAYIFLSEGSAIAFTNESVSQGATLVAEQVEFQNSPLYFPPKPNILVKFNPLNDQEAIPLPPVLSLVDGEPIVAYTTSEFQSAACVQINHINATAVKFHLDSPSANYGGTDVHA